MFGQVVMALASFSGPAAPVDGPWRTQAIDGGEMRYILPRVGTADYPVNAMRTGVQGQTLLSLTVSPAGKITACSIDQSSGSPDLDRRSCEIYLRRARFEFTGISKDVHLRAPVSWMLEEAQAPEPGGN